MKSLRRAVFRQMKLQKASLIGAWLLLFLGAFLFVLLSHSSTVVEDNFKTFRDTSDQEDVHVFISTPIEEQDIASLQTNEISVEQRFTLDAEVENLDNSTVRLFTITERINVPFVQEGRMPKDPQEVALSDMFANEHDIKLGDTILLGSNEFLVVGLVYAPDYIFPLRNENDLINDPKAFGLGYVLEDSMRLLPTKPATMLVARVEDSEGLAMFKSKVEQFTPIVKELQAEDNPRIGYIETELQGTKVFSYFFPFLILALSIAMVTMMISRSLVSQKKQLGTLRALGVGKRDIILAYTSIPFVLGVSSSFLGILGGITLTKQMTQLYTTYFHIPIVTVLPSNWFDLVLISILPTLFLCGVFFIYGNRLLHQPVLDLLRGESSSKKQTFKSRNVLSSLPFSLRFRFRIIESGIGRAIFLFLSVIFATFLLLIGLFSMNAVDEMMDASFGKESKFEAMVFYQSIQQSIDHKEAFSLSTFSFSVEEENFNGSLFGVESDNRLLTLKNEKEEDLLRSLDKGLVINKVTAAIAELEIGDEYTIVLGNGKKVTEQVVGIANLYNGVDVYTTRDKVNSWLALPKGSYLGEYKETSSKVSENVLQVISKTDMQNATDQSMGATKGSIYVMSAVAFIIGALIMSLIARMIIEENSTSISLLKVMGYEQRAISSMLLAGYYPIVLLAFIVAVPLTVFSLESLLLTQVKQTQMIFPITAKPIFIIIGFAIISLSYVVSTQLAKRRLKHISLQEVLKRQER
ncbi:ABC transporter permease [Mangrovibacillus cuniculi]|uniref:ABC transporter permease n=1 Tax=Mangrovibacillus cuniculi TaxID=2593652 RepID=A0A7S8CB78_9BACI|nr:ABC transporter permease [Mangrovibacillus cuniculi]QPC46784.1 ABC transporter permease [Mangrovibacillus cuniculi]